MTPFPCRDCGCEVTPSNRIKSDASADELQAVANYANGVTR
jgi:hypothetical protein